MLRLHKRFLINEVHLQQNLVFFAREELIFIQVFKWKILMGESAECPGASGFEDTADGFAVAEAEPYDLWIRKGTDQVFSSRTPVGTGRPNQYVSLMRQSVEHGCIH